MLSVLNKCHGGSGVFAECAACEFHSARASFLSICPVENNHEVVNILAWKFQVLVLQACVRVLIAKGDLNRGTRVHMGGCWPCRGDDNFSDKTNFPTLLTCHTSLAIKTRMQARSTGT